MRRRWRYLPIAALVAVTLLGTALGAVLIRGGPDSGRRDADAGDASTAGDVSSEKPSSDVGQSGDEEAILELLTTIMDPGAPTGERAALVLSEELRGGVDPAEVIESFDSTSRAAGVTGAPGELAITSRSGDSVAVDVVVPLDGRLAKSATLASVLVMRTDHGWRLTAESLCGMARAAEYVSGAIAPCEGGTELRRAESSTRPLPTPTEVLHEPGLGEPAALGPQLDLPDWGGEPVVIDGVRWMARYPELELGGGGPVGPALVVGTDVESGEDVGEVLLPGTDAQIVAAAGALWALLQPVDPLAAGGPLLARMDPSDPQSVEVAQLGADRGGAITAGHDGVWVAGFGRIYLYRDGSGSPTTEVGVGLVDPYRAQLADNGELWLPRDGDTTLVVAADGSGTREVGTLPGELVLSQDQVWAVLPSGEGLRARTLDPLDGSQLREAYVPFARTSPGRTWSDGQGGFWATGGATGVMSGISAGRVGVDVVHRPWAVHVDRNGQVVSTTWATGGDGGFFEPLGASLGYVDGDRGTVSAMLG